MLLGSDLFKFSHGYHRKQNRKANKCCCLFKEPFWSSPLAITRSSQSIKVYILVSSQYLLLPATEAAITVCSRLHSKVLIAVLSSLAVL
jgi:hypothetical protein